MRLATQPLTFSIVTTKTQSAARPRIIVVDAMPTEEPCPDLVSALRVPSVAATSMAMRIRRSQGKDSLWAGRAEVRSGSGAMSRPRDGVEIAADGALSGYVAMARPTPPAVTSEVAR